MRIKEFPALSEFFKKVNKNYLSTAELFIKLKKHSWWEMNIKLEFYSVMKISFGRVDNKKISKINSTLLNTEKLKCDFS